MDKKGSIIKNFFKSSTPNLVDGQEERSSSPDGTSSKDTVLAAILGSLRLHEGSAPYKTSWNSYSQTDSLYDIVIRINNISDLRSKGWEIALGKHTKSITPNKTSTESRQGVVVTVLGAYNRGKSFLLRKLCKIDLPTGNLISTEGISITAGRETYTNIVFLDTAGTDTAVKNEEIEFKRATDALLREVALHLSTFIIIVVNRLRATDQVYIKEVLKYCKNPSNKKSVIIVHNLLDVETIEDLNKIIKSEIETIFEAKAQTLQLSVDRTAKSINYYSSKQQPNGIEIRHYIMAKAHSSAADIWNRQSLDGIMNLLQNADNKRSLDIINDMIAFINTKLPALFKSHTDSEISTAQQNLQVVQHDNQPYIVLSGRRSLQDLSLAPYALELSEKLVYDDAGYFIRNESGQWQPQYNLYEDDTKYCLILDASGFKKGEAKTKLVEKSITIEGTRADLMKSMTNPTIWQADIPIGSFTLNIPFKNEVNPRDTIVEREDGFIRFTFIKKREEKIELET